MVETLHGERYETLALSSRSLLTLGLSRFPLNLSCSFNWPTSPTVQMSFIIFYRLVHTSDTVEYDRKMNLDGDIIGVLGFQTNVTVLKVKVKVRVWNFGGQLEHR